MANFAFNTNNAGSSGFLTITVAQVSQNWAQNTSVVRVTGTMKNGGTGTSTGTGVTRDISGDGSYNPAKFNFNLSPGESQDFIQHEFTVTHGSEGHAHVNFSVEFGPTGTGTFGSGSSSAVGLELDRIPKRPDRPLNFRITAKGPTTLTLQWDVPDDDNGNAIYDYDLLTYRTFDLSDKPTHNHGDSRTRNLTHLDAGGKYWFVAVAINHAGDNSGVGFPADTVFTQMQPGFWIRINGQWTTADVYIRDGGVWKLTTPYVRVFQTVDGVGQWSTTI
jgi:hypothetical protein